MSLPNFLIPKIFFWTNIFSSPFECGCIRRRSRPLLYNFLFAISCVLEFGVSPKQMPLIGLFILISELVKCLQSSIQRAVCPWCRFGKLFFQERISLIFVFFYPKLIVCFIESIFDYYIMRTIVSSTRNNLAKSLGILIEIYFFTNRNFLFFHRFLFCIQFFQRFLETISANSRAFSVLLLHLDSIEIGIFAKL